MAYLCCVDHVRKTSRDIALRKPLITIGRAKGNDVVLEDPSVSQTHANLLRQGNQVSMTAVGASSDVYLNGSPVKKAKLTDGDCLLIGRHELTYHEGDPTAAEETQPLSVDALEQLVNFSSALMREEDAQRLFNTLLEAVVDVSGAEKGFVIVLKDGERHLAASHNVGKETLDISRVSDTIIDQVSMAQAMAAARRFGFSFMALASERASSRCGEVHTR